MPEIVRQELAKLMRLANSLVSATTLLRDELKKFEVKHNGESS
jgi:hypothetical protein